jgi:hypothetical protein
VETWHPGEEKPVTGRVIVSGNELNLNVPLERGRAFLVFSH